MSHVEILIRIGLAFVFGGLIGLERENANRPAGYRTHLLVCVGSTLIMIVSISMHTVYGSADPSRIAAQVVSGIGFLGAGTIIREGVSIKGLTTAASLWAVSGIGLALGAGFYFSSMIASLAILLTLAVFKRMENYVSVKKRHFVLKLVTAGLSSDILHRIDEILRGEQVEIKNISTRKNHANDTLSVSVEVKLPEKVKVEDLICEINALEEVNSVAVADYS